MHILHFFQPEMLCSLHIKNLALLEEVSIDFDPGFTVVTGETGAGKSILLGALSLLAGGRADKTIIRQGAPACEVEASVYFENPAKINRLLESLELPPCEDGTLILKRSLPREKAPRITVNGSLATLASLQAIGELWIDFHGPSEPRRLLKEDHQMEFVDLYGKSEKSLQEYQKHYQHWRSLISEYEHISSQTKLSADQVDYLKAQLAQIGQIDLSEEGIATLERDFQRQSSAQELGELSLAITNGLVGEEGLQSALANILRLARQLQELDPESKVLADRLASTAIEINDMAGEFSSLNEELNYDPEQSAELQEKMDTWLGLKRRHGTLQGVIDARDDMLRQLEIQGDVGGTLSRLEKSIRVAEKTATDSAIKLRAIREKACRSFSKLASAAIVQLGFKKVEFQAKLHSLEKLGSSGDCRAEFLFSPNVGEAPLPLNRIASSGELARIMLALKTILASLDDIPVLVFDEVDANVGGEVGKVVGQKLAELAKNHQVFCVTHLPQVASQGDAHFVVEKDQSGARAKVIITPIHENKTTRVEELARMLGDRNAKSALSHAKELLK